MAETTRSLMDYAPPPVSGTTAEIRTQAARRPKQSMSLMDFMSDLDLANILSGTGIPERFAAANEVLNPLAAIPRAQAASQEIFAPDRSIMQRIASTGNMLGEVGGVVVPMAASTRIGAPAATALMEGLLGGSPATQAASDAARRFLANESGSVPLPFSAVDDPAQARGAQIIDMLTSGRAGEITDEMLDLGDPVANARLGEYLFKNYDLPMDQASRMERAGQMGFDTAVPLYRGADVDLSDYGRNISTAEGGSGVTFLTDERRVANTYASPKYRGAEGGNVTPAFVRSSKFNEAGYTKPFPENGTEAQIESWMSGNESFNRRLDPEDAKSNYFNSEIARARAMSRDGVVFRQVEDDRINTLNTTPSDVYASFDPTNIRSRFARFDPRLAHLKNLSAGVAPFGLLALQPNEEQYR